MENIQLTETERTMLTASLAAVSKIPEYVAYQAQFDAIVKLRGLHGAWGLSLDHSTLFSLPCAVAALNLPETQNG